MNAINVIDTSAVANAADGLYFCNNRVKSLGTTAATTAIEVDEALDRAIICDNFLVYADVANTPALLEGATFDLTNLEMARNKIFRPSDYSTAGCLLETSSTASSGMVYDNKIRCLDAASILLITTGSLLGFANNLVQGAVDTSGMVLPAIDSDAS